MGVNQRKCAIVGVAESDLGRVPGRTELQFIAQAAKAALEDAGLSPKDIDGVANASIGGTGLMGATLVAEYLGLQPRYVDSTNIGGASFELFIQHAEAAITEGYCNAVLITYGSTAASRHNVEFPRPDYYLPNAQFDLPFGPGIITPYALAATRHMHLYGTTSTDLAEIAVATRKWACMNSKALMQTPITIDNVLNSPMISTPLHRLDCCLVTDGGGAVVVASPEIARRGMKRPVWVLGTGTSQTHDSVSRMPDLTCIAAKESGKTAFERAGLRHDEIDVVEIYDSFTITVLLTLEALGFCSRGEGGTFVRGQRTAPGGDFPMNTQGGGLSYTHPGMFGIFLLIEAARQLRGECGDRQVKNANIALCHGTGGMLATGGTVILGRD